MPAATGTDTGTLANLTAVAARIANRMLRSDGQLTDPVSTTGLEFETDIVVRPLGATHPPPSQVWAVDGGQALVADARCLQVVVTRAARVCFENGACTVEDPGDLRAHVLGGDEGRASLAEALAQSAAAPFVSPDVPVDIALLRHLVEWDSIAKCVTDAGPSALMLVDGALQPDWRIGEGFLTGLLGDATSRGVQMAGVTKHSSLARGGAPLVGQLEREAEATVAPRARWWAPVARTRAEPTVQVVVVRLDPDAHFAFRVDLPAEADPEAVLGALAAVSDDAAFPGYPYPLTVADQLAACPGWLRQEAWLMLAEELGRTGVPPEVVERAFTDRHLFMERS